MDEQLIELRLEAESHAIAHAMVEEALASSSYTDTHTYEGERRSALRRAEMNDWGWC